MAKYKVKNTSKRTVARLGYVFYPNQEPQTIEVNSDRELLALRSVRALELEQVSDDAEVTAQTVESDKQKVREATIDEVLQMVANGEMEASEALQYEKEGKNRTTLVKKLEEIAWEVQEAENRGDYSKETTEEITKEVGELEEATDTENNEG